MNQADKFSPGEKKVIEHLLQGKSNKQIALALGLSERTIEFHLGRIYEKLGVRSRAEAIVQLGKSTVPDVIKEPVESTVEYDMESAENRNKPAERRIPMKHLIAILVGGFLLTVILFRTNENPTEMGAGSPQSKIAGNVTSGITLPIPRARHTVTRFADGKILLIGGYQGNDQSLDDVDLFNPVKESILPVASLHTARHDHSATLLKDGRVLVVGGYSPPQQWLPDAEVYDPSMDTWTVISPHYSHGVFHTATLLRDGRVLVVGGCIGSGVCTDKVEIFDPRTNSWTDAPSLPSDRASHTANLLNDGRVLIAGGENSEGRTDGGDALIYDPKENNWTPTGPMSMTRVFAGSVSLPGGEVLVAGGMFGHGNPLPQAVTITEIYDPTSNTWRSAAPLASARYAFILSTFRGNQVIAIGGSRDGDNVWNEDSFVHEIEVYDPTMDRWETVAQLPQPAAFSAGTYLINDQNIWVTGGQTIESGDLILQATWIISPSQPRP